LRFTPEVADAATMDGRRAIDGKFSVPCEYRRAAAVSLNQSFILFVKTSATVPT